MAGTFYTFNVQCSFSIQYTFDESEIEPDPEGNEDDVQPTEEALKTLQAELSAALLEKYSIDELEAWADSDNLLGIVSDD